MKKKVLRCLAVVAMVAGCMVVALSERGNQQENTMENNSAECRYYEPTEEEFELLYRITYAEAMPNSMNYLVANTVIQRMQQDNYYPSDEERQSAYLMAYAQTRDEEPIIQTMGTNVAINIAKEQGMNLIEVFNNFPYLFSGMHDGVPSIEGENEDGISTWIPVTEDMLTDELKEAVDLAFEQDCTEGATHYYNIYLNYSKVPISEEFIQEGDWIVY